MQNKSKYIYVVLGIIAIIIVAILIVKNSKSNQYQAGVDSNTVSNYDWNSNFKDIKTKLEQAFPDVKADREISIIQTADITGDGIDEALIGMGAGGAYTEYVALMRVKNGTPIVAQVREKNGAIEYPMFLSGASVMHSADVRLDSKKNVVFTINTSTDGETGLVAECTGTAYAWNPQTELFEYSASLSDEYEVLNCPITGGDK